ncbi:MAG: hypothetical protein ACTSR4_09405, partial [Candidatus Hodarchaeales archaeon]
KRLGKLDRLKDIETFLEEHEQYYIYKTTLSKELVSCKDPKKLFGYNVIRFIQLLLYRSKSLIEGSIHALNNNSALSSILSVRAHFETTGSIAYLMKRLASYYLGNIYFEKMDEDLLRFSLGSTTINNPKVPKPIQVLDLIDATDEFLKKKLFEGKAPHDKMFRELYEDLCDFCHPNFQGITSGSDIIDEERAVIFNKTNCISDTDFTFFFHLSMSEVLFIHFYKEVLTLLKEKEIMPIFHKC